VLASGGLLVFAGNLSGSAIEADVQLPGDMAAAGGQCAAFGQGSAIGFRPNNDADTSRGCLTLGPWSAGVVRFPASG
jgi:hypothetical protein